MIFFLKTLINNLKTQNTTKTTVKFQIEHQKWLLVSIAIFMFDQLLKQHFNSTLSLEYSQSVIDGYLNWSLAYNEGISFSLMSDYSGWQRWFISTFSIVLIVILTRTLNKLNQNEILRPIAIALIIGGAIGNLYDRIVLGYVIDFISVYWQNSWNFPIFNIADIGVVVGAFLLILNELVKNKASS